MLTGTTGRPKGATLSHSAIVVQSLAKIAIVGYNENDVCISSPNFTRKSNTHVHLLHRATVHKYHFSEKATNTFQ